jgi:hypothetical protein
MAGQEPWARALIRLASSGVLDMTISSEALAGIAAGSPVRIRREAPVIEAKRKGRRHPTGEVAFPGGVDRNRLYGAGAVEMTGYSARAAPLVGNPIHTDAGRLVVTPDQNRTQQQTDTHTCRQEEIRTKTGQCRMQQDGGWKKTPPKEDRQTA